MRTKLIIAILLALFSIVSIHTIAYADGVYFTSTPNFYATQGTPYTYHVVAVSVHNYSVSYTTSLPSWLSFNSYSNTIVGKATVSGRYTVDITAFDDHGSSEEQSYYLYVSPSATSTPTPTPTMTPTAFPSPTPKPTNTIQPTTTPTPTIVPNGQETSIAITDESPTTGSVISQNNPVIKATIQTAFPLNSGMFSIYIDNIDKTNKATISSTTTPTVYETMFSYKTNNLTAGNHTINLTVDTPDGIAVPESWSFKVTAPNPIVNSFAQLEQKIISGTGAALVVLVIGVILAIIAITALVQRGAKISKEQEATPQTDQEKNNGE